MVQIRKAERRKAKLRLGLSGPSGSGKTMSALLTAFGLGGRVGVIDTEHGSADMYAHLGDYDIIALEAPYTVAKYREAIDAFEREGYDVIVIDSVSHSWAGEGGLLDKQGRIADSGKAKDSFGAWRQVTPDYNALVQAILQSPAHVIVTMRSKTDYVLEQVERGGRTVTVPRKVGLAPVQRDGFEYELTASLDISLEHIASASKDRTGLFDGDYFKPSADTGRKLRAWLESGVDAPAAPAPDPADDAEAEMAVLDHLSAIQAAANVDELRDVFTLAQRAARASGKQSLVDKVIRAKDQRRSELDARAA